MPTQIYPATYDIGDFVNYEMDGPVHANSFLNSLIIPRPIAFVSSIGPEGIINVAPFSYFNVACTNPAMVSLAIERRKGIRKDTSRNIVEHGSFVVNLCSIEMAKSISIAGGDFAPNVSEVDLAKLSLLPSSVVKAPRIANSLAQLECSLFQVIELGEDPTDLILGRIEKVHVHKSVVGEDRKILIERLNPLARLAGSTYAHLSDYFKIPRGLQN